MRSKSFINDQIFIDRIKKIKMLIFDVDGVLTGGEIIIGNNEIELKQFNVQDGMGITLAREAGLKTGIITGRRSEAVVKRSVELKFDVICQGASDKLPALDKIMKDNKLEYDDICYMGDDLLDLSIMKRVGVCASPANARAEVKKISDIVACARGGEGAVREIIELILQIQGKWKELVDKYMEAK